MPSNNLALLGITALSISSSNAFAPSSFLQSSSGRIPSSSSLSYLTNDEDILTGRPIGQLSSSMHSINASGGSLSNSDSNALSALDAEMDTFASPNDKRYSASDWLHNIRNFHNSSILNQIRQPVGVITLWSTLVSVIYKVCMNRGCEVWAKKMCLGSTPHSFIASTIGLLLVFRTNSAYQKFRVSESASIEFVVTIHSLFCNTGFVLLLNLALKSATNKTINSSLSLTSKSSNNRKDARRGKNCSTQHETSPE